MQNTIEVEVPKDITEYQAKIAFNQTGRALVALLLMFVLVVIPYGLAVLFTNINPTVLNVLALLVATPIMGWGYIKKDGLHFEKFVKYRYQRIKKPRRRKFKTENAFDTVDTYKKVEFVEGEVYRYDIKKKKIRRETRKSIRRAKKDFARALKTRQ